MCGFAHSQSLQVFFDLKCPLPQQVQPIQWRCGEVQCVVFDGVGSLACRDDIKKSKVWLYYMPVASNKNLFIK